jgi:glycosyltransferase involved in cell wall biosynthesis
VKIAIIGSRGFPYVYSGYETLVTELSTRLVARGHEVTVYCRSTLFPEKPSVVRGVRLVYLPSAGSKSLDTLSHGLLSTLDVLGRRMDAILYVNSANGAFGALTRLFRKRTAINVDGLEWLRPKWKGLGGKVFYYSSWLATKLFDAVVTDADAMADVYRKEFSAPSTVIAYGAPIATSQEPERLQEFSLTAGDYYLIVGRLIPDNNADVIVRGFERSATKRRLVIVGDVPYKDAYAEGVRKTADPRIRFVGYVRDQALLRELYCNSYAYFHGHEFGGTNPALLKALGYGCGILALDTPFSREVLVGERHGRYFPKSAAGVEEAVLWAESNPARLQQMRETSRSRIEAQYTWEKITDQYEALFRLLSTRASGALKDDI